MSLRQIANADNKAILNDGTMGFGWPINITPPVGDAVDLTGFSNDIAQIIDPDTGTPISGRLVSVVLHIQDLIDAGLMNLATDKIRFNDPKTNPWVVRFADINGVDLTFKIRSADPDRAIGQIVFILEVYDAKGVL